MADKTNPKREVHFRYIKASDYKSHHVDGIHGGLTGRGLLHMNFFVEKQPFPDTETYVLEENSLKLSSEKKTEPAIREVEGALIMDYNTMKSMRDWLDNKIKDFEKNFISPKHPTQKH